MRMYKPGQKLGLLDTHSQNCTSKVEPLHYDGLIFRVAKNVVTANYQGNIGAGLGRLTDIPIIEVNFLFVPGNSGGPVFAANTGRVHGFVHGYRTQKVREVIETVTMIPELPEGLGGTYIDTQTALYSFGIGLNRVRAHLEELGVTL